MLAKLKTLAPSRATLKAVAAGVMAGATAFVSIHPADLDGWLGVAAAVLAAYGVTWRIPNAPSV